MPLPCQVLWHADDFCVAFCRYSSKAGNAKKMYLVNKNIVNLIDDIFWKMGFKTETDAEKVIIRIISLILDYTDYTNYILLFIFRFAWILELPITCGRTNALISPDRLKPWPISFVQPCWLAEIHPDRLRCRPYVHRHFLQRTGRVDRD